MEEFSVALLPLAFGVVPAGMEGFRLPTSGVFPDCREIWRP
jgi:hypothetical protein